MLVRKDSKIGIQVMQHYRSACAACGCGDSDQLEIDHVMPRANGGNNTFENLQVLCRACNGQKGKALIPKLPPWAGEIWGVPPHNAVVARKRWRVTCARAKRIT